MVFPIVKPKPFNCELSNSYLITLFETTHKALISLLNQWLARILNIYNCFKSILLQNSKKKIIIQKLILFKNCN